VKNKICVICKRKEQKEWVEVSPGHKKLVYFCCEELKVKDSGNIILHRFRDPVAFGYDKKTGRLLAIDKKGRTFDPSDTRYDLDKDRYGWKATGKIPKKKKYFI